jgi:hypothetical protein
MTEKLCPIEKANLVINFDEVGISEWEDWKPNKIFLSLNMRGEVIHRTVNKNVKHISVITSISTGGQSFTLYIVTSLTSESVLTRLKERSFRFGLDFALQSGAKV